MLYIKRLHRQIVLRFGMAELRISPSTNELCDRLTQGFPGFESPEDQSLRNVAFALLDQAFEEF
jgi:hypothetical protein